MPEVFLSYSRKDQEFVERLYRRLTEDGIDCFFDKESIPWGANSVMELDRGLDEADLVVVVLSPDFLESEWATAEWTSVVHDDPAGIGRKLRPLLLKKCHLPPFLKSRHSIDVTTEERFKQNYPRILRELRGRKDAPVESKNGAWSLPLRRNRFFVGRDEIMDQLRNAFASQTKSRWPIQAITGLGGVGKTQIALEYAYRSQTQYDATLWWRAESRDALVSDISLHLSLMMPVRSISPVGGPCDRADGEVNPQKLIASARAWLAENCGWLLVLDNVEDPALVDEILPTQLRGHVLITSRLTHFHALGIVKPVEVSAMSSPEALELLKRSSGRNEDEEQMQELGEELGFLPLALNLAAAYLANNPAVTVAACLADFRSVGVRLLERAPRNPAYPMPIAKTWVLSFEKVHSESRAAGDILHLATFLNPDYIPLELFKKASNILGDRLATAVRDPLEFGEAVSTPARYSLITLAEDRESFSIHRLVQAVMLDQMSPGLKEIWSKRALSAVNQGLAHNPNVLIFSVNEDGKSPELDRFYSQPLRRQLLLNSNSCVEFLKASAASLECPVKTILSQGSRNLVTFCPHVDLVKNRQILFIYDFGVDFRHPKAQADLELPVCDTSTWGHNATDSIFDHRPRNFVGIHNSHSHNLATVHLRYLNDDCLTLLEIMVFVPCETRFFFDPLYFNWPGTSFCVESFILGPAVGLAAPPPSKYLGSGRLFIFATVIESFQEFHPHLKGIVLHSAESYKADHQPKPLDLSMEVGRISAIEDDTLDLGMSGQNPLMGYAIPEM